MATHRRLVAALSIVAGLLAAEAARAAGPAAPAVSFAAKPVAAVDGGTVKISFALSAQTDAEVAILDSTGQIVRHLAAGLLGPNAPAPFQKDSLKQELVWDGKDDAGQAILGDAARGPFKVRVSAGLSAEPAGAAFSSGQGNPRASLTNVIGLAAGPEGQVYVLSERWKRAWWRGTAIHVFKPAGEYDKTIKPFPANTPADRVAGLTGLREADGRPVPVIYRVLAMSYYPKEDLAQHMAVTPDGNIHLLVEHVAYFKDREGEKWLASLAADGGLAYAAYTGGEFKGETGPGDLYLAPSSDGKAVFATGMERGPGKSSTDRPNVAAIYRIDLPDRKEAKVFFGDPAKAGAGDGQLSDPRGLAADGQGHLYVADRGNNRVVILDEKDGKPAGSIQVASPTWLGVSRLPSKPGALYVVSGGELIKFAGAGDKFSEKARVKLPEVQAREGAAPPRRSFALSEQGQSVSLWVGLDRGADCLMRCQDKGDAFGPWARAGYEPAETPWNIAAAQDGHTVACKVGGVLRVLDEQTGKARDISVGGSGETFRFGPNNQIYGIINGGNAVRRMDKDGRSLPFPQAAGAKGPGGRLPVESSGTTSWERDLDVDRAGNIYVKQRGKAYHGRMTVDKYDKDGKLLGTVIWVLSDGAYGPRVDAAGNLYIAEAIKPVGQPVPDFFKGKLPDAPVDSKGNVVGQYTWMYGSIVKFTPAGGAVLFPIQKDVDAYTVDSAEFHKKLPAGQAKVNVEVPFNESGSRVKIGAGELEGAAWFRYGCSYVLDMHVSHNRRCHCTATEMDADDYGRVFYTDQGRFRVVVLDTNGNELLTFGGYGNQSDGLAGKDIAFDWFTGLGATDRNVYVADGGSHRVVRVALKHAAEEACPIK